MWPDSKTRSGVPFYPDDTIEDLQRSGLRLLQKKQGFRFGTDSVLLAAYAASFCQPAGRRIRIADLGAGCGAVSMLLAARLPLAELVGLELDPASCGTLDRNSRLNQLTGRLHAIEGDIRDLPSGKLAHQLLKPHSFDLVVSNPPYRRPGHTCRRPGQPASPARQQALEETELSLDELFKAAATLLKAKGRLVLVHRVFRLPDVIAGLRANDFEPQHLRLIQSLPGREPTTFLIAAVRQGKPGGFRTETPIVVCAEPGQLSDEAAAWYGHELPLSQQALFAGLYRAESPDQGAYHHD